MSKKSSKEDYYHYVYSKYTLFKEIVGVYKFVGGEYEKVALKAEEILTDYEKEHNRKNLKEAHDVIDSIKRPDHDVWNEGFLEVGV